MTEQNMDGKTQEKIKNLVQSKPLILFMKGEPQKPPMRIFSSSGANTGFHQGEVRNF